MKRVLTIKENSASQAMGSLKSAYRRGFTRGLALGLILLAAFIVLSGGLLYGEGSGDALFIDKDGNVGIGTNNPKAALDIQQKERTSAHPESVKGLYVTGDFGPATGVEFRHTNGSSGIGFGYDTIYATGENNPQNLNLKPRGTGSHVRVQGDLKVDGIINAKGATTLKNNLTVHGNVGIGTKNPEAKLHVKGKVYSENARMEVWKDNEIKTSSRKFVDMPDMNVKVTTGNRPLFILFVVSEAWANEYAYYDLRLDDESIGNSRNHNVSRHSSVVVLRMPIVPAGSHTIKVQWKVSKGVAQSLSTRTLTVIEL